MVQYQKPSQREWTQMATGKEIRKSLLEIGAKGLTFAEAQAAEFVRTGDYAKSFQLVESTNITAKPRAEVRLENTSDHAAAIEWPHPDSKKHHPVLRMTLEYLSKGV